MRAASLRHAESVCEIETCLHGDTHTRHTPTRPGSRPRSRAALDSSSVCTSILLSVSDMVNGRALRTDGDALARLHSCGVAGRGRLLYRRAPGRTPTHHAPALQQAGSPLQCWQAFAVGPWPCSPPFGPEITIGFNVEFS